MHWLDRDAKPSPSLSVLGSCNPSCPLTKVSAPQRSSDPLRYGVELNPQEEPSRRDWEERSQDSGERGVQKMRTVVERQGREKAARTQCVVGTLDVDIWRADGLIA